MDSWCKDLSYSYGHDSITIRSTSVVTLKIKKKKILIPESSKRQHLNLSYASNHIWKSYFHSIYIVSGIMSNLEMIEVWGDDTHGLYANTMMFYKRDLSICGFWYPWGSWSKPPWILCESWLCVRKYSSRNLNSEWMLCDQTDFCSVWFLFSLSRNDRLPKFAL